MKELQKEDGNTQNSIDNIDFLVTYHGPIRFLIHHVPADPAIGHMTFFVFRDGHNHTATGFSVNFGDEERRALIMVIKKYLARYDITWERFASNGLRINPHGNDLMILHGQGIGEEIHNFALGKKRMEVW